ncbi:MAG TPA: hypothetical protein VI636_11810 [Candidatus Angelobacter sp.]
MRIVVKINNAIAGNDQFARKLANATASLLRDGHFVTIIAGDRAETSEGACSRDADPVHSNGNHLNGTSAAPPASYIGAERRLLSSCLSHSGVPSLALCGTDAGICRLRRRSCQSNGAAFVIEVSSVDSAWIQLICANGGVPVISNLVVESSEAFHLADPDQMAALCAIGWNADALVYVTESDGITDGSGTAIRWLDMDDIGSLEVLLDGSAIVAVLRGCRQALQGGVRRTRILPVSGIDALPLFYFSRIESGTEIVMAIERRSVMAPRHSDKTQL